MKIDRAAFLALTMSIASFACSNSDDGTSSSEGAATAAGGQCIINPTTESVSGPGAEGANAVLGFDPVNNFSAAESFCFDRVFGAHPSDGAVTDVSKQSLYMKCNSYGKLYVPWTMREAYQQVQQKSRSGTLTFAILYAIDHKIVEDSTICATPAAKTLCATQSKDQASCLLLASQLKPEKQASLVMCMVKGFDTFTCSEGGLDTSIASVSSGVGSGCLVNPTSESISGPAAEGANRVLGFDPVNDFPAAESFCFQRVFGSNSASANVTDPSKQSAYMKCNSYAKLYVPWTMRFAYQQIQQNSKPGTLAFETMYKIDKGIVSDATICSTPEARTLCSAEKDKVACVLEASQLKPAMQSRLSDCLDSQGFDTYTCAEGGLGQQQIGGE